MIEFDPGGIQPFDKALQQVPGLSELHDSLVAMDQSVEERYATLTEAGRMLSQRPNSELRDGLMVPIEVEPDEVLQVWANDALRCYIAGRKQTHQVRYQLIEAILGSLDQMSFEDAVALITSAHQPPEARPAFFDRKTAELVGLSESMKSSGRLQTSLGSRGRLYDLAADSRLVLDTSPGPNRTQLRISPDPLSITEITTDDEGYIHISQTTEATSVLTTVNLLGGEAVHLSEYVSPHTDHGIVHRGYL